MRFTRDVLYIAKDDTQKGMAFQVNDNQPFLKRKRLDFTFKPDSLKLYSPVYRVGDLVRVKTRKEFEKHFLTDSSTCPEGEFDVCDIRYGFSWSMNKFCGKTFEVTRINGDLYTLNGENGYSFHSDMLVRGSSLYEEV